MKPQTKLQREIVELSKELTFISEDKINWAYNNCLANYGVRSRNTLFCLECGNSWSDKSSLLTAIDGCVCPNCDTQLKMYNYTAVNYREAAYFAVLETKNDFQIVRMFLVSKDMKKREKAYCFSQEVMQHWIDLNGNITTLAKSVQGLAGGCYDRWVAHSDLEIRGKSYGAELRSKINPYKIHPNRKVLPILKRNGFNGRFFDFTPHKWFSILLSNNKAETLIKAKQFHVLKDFNEKKITKYWNSIKICIRNNYTIADASMWFDYLDLLEYFKKDLNGPNYACPADLLKAHNKLMNKKEITIKRNKLNKMRQEIELSQVDFEKQKNAFFGLFFKEGKIEIKVIDSVKGFLQEGDYHKHCVFTNAYYEKENSLILSASVKNKPAETIEVSLDSLTIKQARGRNNKATKYHNKIIDLVNKNMFQIQHILKKQTA